MLRFAGSSGRVRKLIPDVWEWGVTLLVAVWLALMFKLAKSDDL